MGKSKKKASRKEDSEVSVSVTMENTNGGASLNNDREASADAVVVNPPSVDADDTTIEHTNHKTARIAEEYKRVKAQLESEGQKLQHLTERRTTEQALSNPNASTIDRMFTMEKSGLYVYKGPSTCCFDPTSQNCASGKNLRAAPCKHELCARASFLGITWKELDTVKWYDLRIRQEKTPRMKGALMKQREVELTRIKQFEDEELAKHARRYKRQDRPHAELPEPMTDGLSRDRTKATQDLEQHIFEARLSLMQMFKHAAFVGARQWKMADMAKCSDAVSMAHEQKDTCNANLSTLQEQQEAARLRLETLNKDTEWYEEQIEEAAKATQSSTSWQISNLDLSLDITKESAIELCTLVTGLLADVGMPVEAIDNLEYAQSALRHVMSQPASKQSPHVRENLDSIEKVIHKIETLPKTNWPSSTGSLTRPPQTITLGDLRNRIIKVFSKEGYMASPIYAQLMQLENAAHNEARDVYEQLMNSPTELAVALEKIREKATSKSPAPKITGKMLDIYNSTFHDISKASAIVQDIGHTSDQVLVAKISGFVFVRAEKKLEWLVDAFTIVETALEAVYMNPLPERLSHALQRVNSSVHMRVQAKAHQHAASVPYTLAEHALPSIKPAKGISQNRMSGNPTVPMVGATLHNPPNHEAPPWTAHEQSIIETVDAYSARTASMYSSYLSRQRYCPGCATLRISQLLAALIAKQPDRVNQTIAALAAGHSANAEDDTVSKAPTQTLVPERWTLTVSHGIRYITEMVYAIMSGLNVDWSLEQKATTTGNIIVTVMAIMVFDLEFEEILTQVSQLEFASNHLAQFEAVLDELSADERMACAPFRNDCFRHESDLHSEDSQPTRSGTPTDIAALLSKIMKPGAVKAKADTALTSNGVTSTTVTASIVPGGPWRKLLPRGQRYQSYNTAMKAAAEVASIDPSAAKKMSDFCVLKQKIYEQIGLTLPPDVLYCMKELRGFASTEPKVRAWNPDDCQCPRCIASRMKAVNKPSKFVENCSEIYRNGFEITIDGRGITDDEIFAYTGATVERIRSIASGKANLKYICWVARKVHFEADAAQSAGKSWTMTVRHFEEFFTHYAPMPRELELALELTNGELWQSPRCLKNYPTEDMPLIHDILDAMIALVANEPPFAHPDDETWRADWIAVSACADDTSLRRATAHVKKPEAALNVSPDTLLDALLDALKYCFGDPSKFRKFEEFMKRTRKDSLTHEGFETSSFVEFLEQMRRTIHEGKAGDCKELVLRGFVRAMSTQEVTGVASVDCGSPSLVPEPLNIRRNWLDRVIEANLWADVVKEALAMSEEQLVRPGKTQQAEIRSAQLQVELTQAEKYQRQAAAVQAQIEAMRQISDITGPSQGTTSLEDWSRLQETFIAYEDTALPVINYLKTVSGGKGVSWTDDDPQIEIAARVQMQYFDCVRMMQLMAESRCWHEQAEQMKRGLDHCGLQEDEEGHYPDFWGATESSGDSEEEGERGGQHPSSPKYAQEAQCAMRW